MNMPPHPESSLQFQSPDREASRSGSYAPSVPISVYRELAAELNATKAMVDALSSQNQQLTQQNQILRQEFLRFADSADQLRQAIASTQGAPADSPAYGQVAPNPYESSSYQDAGQTTESANHNPVADGVSNLAAQMTRIVKVKKTKPESQIKPAKAQPADMPVLYTEQRPEKLRTPTSASRSQDLSGLWLATTILVIVFSAFGAGFLIMKPLLSNSR